MLVIISNSNRNNNNFSNRNRNSNNYSNCNSNSANFSNSNLTPTPNPIPTLA